MSAFADGSRQVSFPPRYIDAQTGLRVRVFDRDVSETPVWVETTEVGDGLKALVTWAGMVVSTEVAESWCASIDELMATARRNVNRLTFQRKRLVEEDPACVVVTLGHWWVSSLVVGLTEGLKGHEGAIVAIPRADVMLTAPVVGAPTVDSLETMMALCEELFDPADGGVSPHIYWSWDGGLYRVTDRFEDGEVDFQPSRNVSAFYLAGALEHLANPCEECGRTRPATVG